MDGKHFTVGVVSLFYNSTNYGGVLQSYALVKGLNSLDVNAYQICYQRVSIASKRRFLNIFNPVKLCRFVKGKIHNLRNAENRKKVSEITAKRFKPFSLFVNANIPKTDKVYNQNTIKGILDDTDIFITGSDQVWNVNYYDEIYRLDFVPQTKYKFSYAAGVSSGELTKKQKNIFQKSLSTYDSISVRERETVNVLQSLTDKKVEWVLDPTLLLSREKWDNVCANRKIEEAYIFCYFLGSLSIDNGKIIEFAHKRGLKVVMMPYLTGTSCDDSDFGDYKIYDAAPQDFISLIKYAEYVFTDSFHATVFSHIYKKNFFVFNRAGLKSMNDRIYSLTSLFDTQDRFCDTKERDNLEYIESLPPIDYNRPFPKFEAMKEKSINFLKNNLKRAEEKTNGVK